MIANQDSLEFGFQLHGTAKPLSRPSTAPSQKSSHASCLPVSHINLHARHHFPVTAGTLGTNGNVINLRSLSTSTRPSTANSQTSTISTMLPAKLKSGTTQSSPNQKAFQLQQKPSILPSPRISNPLVLHSSASSASLASASSYGTTGQVLTLAEVVDRWVAESPTYDWNYQDSEASSVLSHPTHYGSTDTLVQYQPNSFDKSSPRAYPQVSINRLTDTRISARNRPSLSVDRAAQIIQIWYRHHLHRRREQILAIMAEKRRLLDLQRNAHAPNCVGVNVTESVQSTARKKREERARAARQEAILELKSRRISNTHGDNAIRVNNVVASSTRSNKVTQNMIEVPANVETFYNALPVDGAVTLQIKEKEMPSTPIIKPNISQSSKKFLVAAEAAEPSSRPATVQGIISLPSKSKTPDEISTLIPSQIASHNPIAEASLHKPRTRSASSRSIKLKPKNTPESNTQPTSSLHMPPAISATIKIPQKKEVQPVTQDNVQIVHSVVNIAAYKHADIETIVKPENSRIDSTDTLVGEWRPSLEDLPPVPATPTAEVHDDEISLAPSVTELATTSIIDDAANKRVDRILDFLRRVEEDNIVNDIETPTSAEIPSRPPPPTAAVFDSVKAKIMGQQLEIEDKSRTLNILKKELKKFKEINKEQLVQHRKDLKSKLNLQRKEYENIVKRHLTFVDKLLAEKEDLSKRCESLSEDVRNLEKQFQARIATMEETHTREIARQKDVWTQSEKTKREKWKSEVTRQIKDQTVRGLEPQIQGMLVQHKAAIRTLEEKHVADLARERSQIAEAQNRISESLRDRLAEERRKACEEEREFARQRYQKMLEREEMEHTAARRKMVAEWDEQRTQILENAKEEKRALEQLLRQKDEESRRAIEAERASNSQSLEEARRKATHELSQLRERLAVEKEEWQSQQLTKFESDFRNREKLLRETLVRERNKEIERVTECLAFETSETSSDASRRHRIEIERIQSETADKIRELKDQNAMAMDRVICAQNAAKEAEKRCKEWEIKSICAQDEAKSKEVGLEKMRSELKRLKVDEETLACTIRRGFDEEILRLGSEIKSLRDQLSSHNSQTEVLRRKHGFELEQIVKEKDEALSKLERRVYETIQNKDETIRILKKQVDELKVQVEDSSIRSHQLEKLIEKQREEMLRA